MELRQFEYLVAVAQEGNFTRAAERVHISQSGISAQIRELERDLGAPLFDRSGRTATLTSAGEAAIEYAQAALASVSALRQAVDEVNGLIRGTLVIGMVTACTVTPLFDALAAFHRDHPGVEITLVEDNSDRLVEQVRAGAMDMALIGAAGSPPAGLGSTVIISEGLVAAVPADHPLARARTATLAEVAGFPIVCLPQGTGVRSVLDQARAQKGIKADIALQASAPAAVAELAARGLGVAVLSDTMAAAYRDTLDAIKIDDIEMPSLLALIWSSQMSPALSQLKAQTRRAFGQPPSASPMPGDRPETNPE